MADKRCYMIIVADITDRERFLEGYATAVPKLVEEFGGRYLIRGGGGVFLEGGWCDHPSALVSEWSSKAAALAFWNSPQYAAVKPLRAGAGRFQVLLIES
jgi:uncharacterized protein (DUF1330 family)